MVAGRPQPRPPEKGGEKQRFGPAYLDQSNFSFVSGTLPVDGKGARPAYPPVESEALSSV